MRVSICLAVLAMLLSGTAHAQRFIGLKLKNVRQQSFKRISNMNSNRIYSRAPSSLRRMIKSLPTSMRGRASNQLLDVMAISHYSGSRKQPVQLRSGMDRKGRHVISVTGTSDSGQPMQKILTIGKGEYQMAMFRGTTKTGRLKRVAHDHYREFKIQKGTHAGKSLLFVSKDAYPSNSRKRGKAKFTTASGQTTVLTKAGTFNGYNVHMSQERILGMQDVLKMAASGLVSVK